MSINNDFYSITNELVARATKGTVNAIVDYASFVDAGKALGDMDISDWANPFMTALIQKIQLTVNIFRSYTPDLVDMEKSTVKGGAIELLMHTFYSTRQSMFTNLQDGGTVDPFIIAKPSIQARYYINTDTYSFAITRSDDDLQGAFRSPEELDAFYSTIMGDVLNSIQLHKEVNRLGALCSMMASSLTNTEESSTYGLSTSYNVLKIYNTLKGTSLSESEFLTNADAVLWTVSFMRYIKRKLRKPSESFNEGGLLTFTPESDITVKVISEFETAMRTALLYPYNKEYGLLGDYETLAYWQNEKTPLQFTTSDSDTSTLSPKVLCTMYDKQYAVGEYPDFVSAESIRNPRGRYTNTFWNIKTRYIRNGYANAVVFYIKE